MWPFKKKKERPGDRQTSPVCPHCRSDHTAVITCCGTDIPDCVKIWRGQRYVTCKCLDCTREFYIEEPPQGLAGQVTLDSPVIDDPDELQAAEEELKRQVEEDGDRMCW